MLAGPSWASALGESAASGSGSGATALSTTAPLDGNDTATKLAVADTTWALKAWADGSLLAQHREEWHRFCKGTSNPPVACDLRVYLDGAAFD